MARKQSALSYVMGFAFGLTGLTATAVFAFWQVTGSEVRRSAQEAEAKRRPPPPVVQVVDTTTPWAPTPEAAMEDTVYTLRMEGRLAEALAVLERWLQANPDDRPRRLVGARLSFEARRRDRGVFHYKRYLLGSNDRYILGEAVARFLSELPPAEARDALVTLLPVDDEDFPVRIGLARATAEASDFAGADTLLAPIPPHFDGRVDELRLQVRRSLNPDIATAEQWVAQYPEETHYRLVLARAYGRADRPGDALPHYLAAFAVDTTLDLRQETADVAVAADSFALASRLLEEILAADSTRDRALLSLARARVRMGDDAGAVRAFEQLMERAPDSTRFAEARGVLFEVNDVQLTLPLIARLLAFKPDDHALRLRYAQDLERVQRFPAAEAQYDTLLVQGDTPALLLARARVRLTRNDLQGAVDDAHAAEALEPSIEAAVMQGDVHRWRQERDAARFAYDRAALISATDPRVIEGRRLLAIQRRDALAYEPAFGTGVTSSGLTDSDGFDAFTLRAQQGLAPLADETILTAAAEVRRATGALGTPLNGLGGDLGVARYFGKVNVLARLGAMSFEGGGAVATGLLEVSRSTQTWALRGALSQLPAYESLRSGAVLAPDDVTMGTTLLMSFSAQVRPRIDVYAQADHTSLQDGNGRSVVAASARYALGGPWAVLYTASAATYAEGTADYWSPESFVTQGVGVDVRRDRREGWSLGARLAPSYAWVRETAPGAPTGLNSALQATMQADATWRKRGVELGLYAGYGQDRAGNYAAGFGGLRARITR